MSRKVGRLAMSGGRPPEGTTHLQEYAVLGSASIQKRGKGIGYLAEDYVDHPLGPWKKDPHHKPFLGGRLAVFEGPDDRNWFCYCGEKNPQMRLLSLQ